MHTKQQFWHPVSDVILKHGKDLVKTVFVTVSGNSSYKNCYNINRNFNHKTFTGDHVR